jgi:hypothetical protein
MVIGEETKMFGVAAANVPLTITTGLEVGDDLAMFMPLPRLHTGACAVPALLSEHETTGPT